MTIHLHWLWIPLIVTLILIVLTYVFEDPKISAGVFSILASFSTFISAIIYIIAGIWWLFTHIKIVT